MIIPIKYKKRLCEHYREEISELVREATPSSDFGRSQNTSSMIPNLGVHRLEKRLKNFYGKSEVIFTSCATDALDLVMRALPMKTWAVPTYTWFSPINALKKADKEIIFHDVKREDRMLDFKNIGSEDHLLLAHVDGLNLPLEKKVKFVVEDAAQSPLGPKTGMGDVTILSFGSSKRMGLLGQGGCVLTNSSELADRLRKLTMFGLEDDGVTLSEAGDKSFLSPFDALCTDFLYQHYQKSKVRERLQEITEIYNEASGLDYPWYTERYTLQSEGRDTFHQHGVETRVWFQKHALEQPAYKKYRKHFCTPVSDVVVKKSFDVPFNEFLQDSEIELIAGLLRKLRPSLEVQTLGRSRVDRNNRVHHL